jgi:FAD/FMN-containing dehydrogenase
VVLADGRVWDGLRALRKDNSGYDLKQLFLGAEGTLGVITAAVLKLHPKPAAQASAWIGLASPAHAVELLAHLRTRLGERISAFELVSRRCLEAVLAHDQAARDPLPHAHAWYVLAQFDLALEPETLAAAPQVEDAVLASSTAQALSLWRIRETIPEAQFANVKHDVSVPVSRVPELIARAEAALQSQFPGAPQYAFGHIGDGNIHFNVGDAALLARREEVNRVVYGVVAALGGSISAEHGLGQMKREQIRRHKDALEMELMRAVKRALDPQDLMNPGKVL